jgi:hypothetical protein
MYPEAPAKWEAAVFWFPRMEVPSPQEGVSAATGVRVDVAVRVAVKVGVSVGVWDRAGTAKRQRTGPKRVQGVDLFMSPLTAPDAYSLGSLPTRIPR